MQNLLTNQDIELSKGTRFNRTQQLVFNAYLFAIIFVLSLLPFLYILAVPLALLFAKKLGLKNSLILSFFLPLTNILTRLYNPISLFFALISETSFFVLIWINYFLRHKKYSVSLCIFLYVLLELIAPAIILTPFLNSYIQTNATIKNMTTSVNPHLLTLISFLLWGVIIKIIVTTYKIVSRIAKEVERRMENTLNLYSFH